MTETPDVDSTATQEPPPEPTATAAPEKKYRFVVACARCGKRILINTDENPTMTKFEGKCKDCTTPYEIEPGEDEDTVIVKFKYKVNFIVQ